MDWSFWVSVPLSAIIVAAAGAFIGTLTLRLRGPYFTLSTLAFSAAFYKMLYILRPVTGGDEGITGLEPFSMTIDGDLQVTAVIFIICVFLMTAFAGSHYGLILRATRHNEEAAQASGVNTAYYKIIGFAVSAFFAGIAGAVQAHVNMQATPEAASGALSVMIVLMATIGGAGTLAGPILAAAGLAWFDQWLRIWEHYRIIIYMATLVGLIYINPKGIGNANWIRRTPWIRHTFLGRQ